jgi:CubicO group peptidase (beta-lactamase class C family)
MVKQGNPLSEQFLMSLPRLMTVASVPGLAIALITEGQLSWAGRFGVTNATAPQPVQDDTVFQAASLSKPVFALAVLRLKDEGLLDLDRPLSNYQPDLYAEFDPRVHTITARQVLSHTTGLQNWRLEKDEPLQLAFTPGERFSYSGEGYVYLQRVVEHITGQAFESYMQKQVLRPLGMSHSSYIWLPEHERELASGHHNRGQPAEPWNAWQGRRMLELARQGHKPLADWCYEDVEQALPAIHPDLAALPNNMIPNAAGSLLTTASEFAHFMTQVMEHASPDQGYLTDSTRCEMLTPHVHLHEGLAWGLGWGLASENGEDTFWHWGENGLFQNFALGNPSRRSGIVVLTNSDKGLKVCERIVNEFVGYLYPAFLWV